MSIQLLHVIALPVFSLLLFLDLMAGHGEVSFICNHHDAHAVPKQCILTNICTVPADSFILMLFSYLYFHLNKNTL